MFTTFLVAFLSSAWTARRKTTRLRSEISERERVEIALRQNEEVFRGTFDFSPVGQAMSDLDYRYLRCNEAFCRFLITSSRRRAPSSPTRRRCSRS